jgi:hypothetical protein
VNNASTMSPSTVGIIIGLCFGVPAGMLYVWVQLAWRSVKGARDLTSAAQRTAWSRSRQAIVFGLLLIIGTAFMIGHH